MPKKKKKESYLALYIGLGLLVLIIGIGTTGYMVVEGFTFSEAFYMTIITMATVGFREVRPLSSTGMWFTAGLIIFSFGIFAYAITTLTRFIVEGVSSNYFKEKRMKKHIDKLRNHVIVCGYGRNGAQAVKELEEHNIPIIIIENHRETVEMIRESGEQFVIEGDATQDETLNLANIQHAQSLITTLPADADNLFVVLSARELNPKLQIISRASDDNSDNKLKSAGANNVIMPNRIGGRRMAKLVTQPEVIEFIEYVLMQATGSVFLEEVLCEKFSPTLEGKTIEELDIRNESGVNVIGIKKEDQTFVINPAPETVLTGKDKIFVLGNKNEIAKMKEILSHL
jgi:voltage-gated potassium channel